MYGESKWYVHNKNEKETNIKWYDTFGAVNGLKSIL